MLDCDASFVTVPEFASTRRSLPASLMGATALRDAPQDSADASGSAPVQKAERQKGETFTSAMQSAFFDHLPASDLPPIPVPPLADLRAEAARAFTPPAAPISAPTASSDEAVAAPDLPLQDDAADADARPVTPRRPLRFTAARSMDEATPVSLPSFNLFDGVFDETALQGPDVDPRLQRSRARARAQLAAMEATLSPVERNLWHDDTPETVAPVQTLATEVPAENPAEAALETVVARAEGAPVPRRPVRHLTPGDASRTPRPAPQIHDPLRDRLRDLRDILYTPSPEEAEAAARAATKPARPPVHAMALALLLPVLALLSALLTALTHATGPKLGAGLAARPKAIPTALTQRVARTVMGTLTRSLPSAGFGPRLATAAASLAAIALPINQFPVL